jgi:pentatricopeptide repeat protein
MVERFYIESVIWTCIICGYCQAARSTEFEAMFRNVESKIIEVAEMSLEELNAFVSFFYKATIDANVLLKHSPALLQAANKYKVDFLTSICEEALVTNISKENVISKFFVAKKHCSEAVMEAVLKEATTLGDVSTFTEYKKYSQTDAGLLLEFYEKLARLKKAKGSKRRRVGKAAEPGTGSPTLNNSTSFVGSNGKAEKEDDKEEDYHKGEEKEGEMGKRKVKEEGSFGKSCALARCFVIGQRE